jgi:hypothetical protein
MLHVDICSMSRCQLTLISAMTVRNCLKFYKIAEEINASILETHCSQLISTHWVVFSCRIIDYHVNISMNSL